jgi:hypothetical protein
MIPCAQTLLEYVARVFVWKADNLQPADPNGKADPYLKCSLGSFSQSNRKQHIKKTLAPDFYTFYEIPVSIPGDSTLKLSVYDWDRFHLPGTVPLPASRRRLCLCCRSVKPPSPVTQSDTLIGETSIDIEDRWFHKKWKAMGQSSSQEPVSGPPKFIEVCPFALQLPYGHPC